MTTDRPEPAGSYPPASVADVAKTLKVREQHIAVFGASGSGKTVLVSSFYGAAQEAAFVKESLFYVLADDTGRGNRLLQNYLGMKNRAAVPEANRFSATAHSFTIKIKESGDARTAKAKPFDALRLVWHDYPGEWFDEEPSSDEEARRRVDAFRSLVRSDVALILVDGQKLLDHAGEEQKYLKSLFWSLRSGLLRLKDELLDDGEPVAQFPRIWIIALSKADLHPGLDAHGLRDLIIEKAADDVASLHDVVKGLVKAPEAMSIGEDFMLLSSAKFEPDEIKVTERVGVDLILPIASLLPLERLAQWSQMADLPLKLLGDLGDNAEGMAAALVGAKPFAMALSKVPKIGPALSKVALPALVVAFRLGGSKIKEIHTQALASRDNLTATLTHFRLQLDEGVDEGLLIKSVK